MPRRVLLLFVLLSVITTGPTARADEFDRLEGPALASVPERKGVKTHTRLTVAELGNLPAVLRGTRSPLVVVKTDQGNLARLLLEPAFRKPPGGQGEPVPVLAIERFATYEAGKATTRLARGQEVLLFDGFRFDLDSGQVVPEGQGGDLQFVSSGEGGPRLRALEGSTLYTLADSPVPAAAAMPGPSPGRAVLPADFTGRYRLFANGQMSGTLELSVDAKGAVTGQLRSDLNGAIYPVTGQVSPEVPQKITFKVTYPRTQHDFEGYLWTEGKGAMAGSVVMSAHPHGFFAIREGGRYAPEGEDVGPLTGEPDRPGRIVLELKSEDQFLVAGKPVDRAGLAAALRAAAADRPEGWVLLRVPADLPYSAVRQACSAAESAGIRTIRCAVSEAAKSAAP